MKRLWELVRHPLVVLILLATVWLGLKEGYDGYRGAETMGQRIGSVAQVLYGLGALATLTGIYLRARWLRYAMVGWGLNLTVTGALSPVVWGGAPWTAGLFSGTATALVSAALAWATLTSIRDRR